MANPETAESVDLSDSSPLVSLEVGPAYRTYGGIDSPVFVDEEAFRGGEKDNKHHSAESVAQSEDDVADKAVTEAKFRALYHRNANLHVDSHPKKGHRYLQQLREMPWTMKEKLAEAKRVRIQLGEEYFKGRERQNFIQKGAKKIQKGKKSWDHGFGPLDKSIKKIQAYFGSGVASYFVFLRRIIWLDVAIALVVFGFICVPQIFVQEGTVLDLTQHGLGALQNSIVFYGYYEAASSFGHYAMPLAYLLTVLAVMSLSVVTIVVWMSVSYRKSKMSTTQVEYTYGQRLFAGWDFSISRADGVYDRQLAIKTDFQEVIWEHKLTVEKACSHRCCLYGVRVITNLMVLGLLAGSGYAIYYVSQHQFEDSVFGTYTEIVEQYKLSLVVAALKLCMPVVLVVIGYVEDWTPRFGFNITLARTTFFYFASLLVFILSLFASFETETSTDVCQNLTSAQPILPVAPEDGLSSCWETEIGEEVFKLILLDFAASLAVVFVFDVLRAALVKSYLCCNRVTYNSFDVTGGVLDVVYCQGLIWLGIYFSPLVPLFGVLKLLLTFAIRYMVARLVNVPPKQLYRASRSGNFNMAILLANLFLCMYPLMVVLFQLRPSRYCGPFRAYCFVYQVLTRTIGEVPEWLGTAIEFVCSPEVIIPVLVLLLLVVIYYKIKSSSYKDVIKELREQLKFERREVRRRVFNVARKTNAKTGT